MTQTSKPLAEEEDDNEGTLKSFIISQVDKFFIGHLPIDSFKDLPPTYMYYFGTVAYMATIALFVYFTYTNYRSSQNQAYIAVDSSTGDCSSVPISITGSYYGDSAGTWVGSPSFVYSEAPFSLFLNNFEVSSQNQYSDMMAKFYQGLQYIGNKGKDLNLPLNLVVWMSYIQYYSVDFPDATNFTSIGHGQLQYIQLTGDPLAVFDLAYTQGHFISYYGYCPITSYATFDKANGLLETALNYTNFVDSYICDQAVIPASFGYSSTIDSDVFAVSIEVRAFSTAMAVNLGIMTIDDLGVASSSFYYFSYGNTSYQVGQYYDVRYYEMDTLICIHNVTAIPAESVGIQNLCMYLVGNTLALPTFNHFGTTPSYPNYCNCSTGVGQGDDCQAFNLMTGLIFFRDPKQSFNPMEKSNVALLLEETGILYLMRLVTMYEDYYDLNRAAYNASFLASAPSYEMMDASVETAAFRHDAFQFCAIAKNKTCSILVFNSIDGISQTVSDYKLQLTNGSCANSIDIKPEAWDLLQNNPPVELTQTYYKCYEDNYDSFISAVGIATGNTSLAVPSIVMLMLPLLYLLLVAIRQVPPKEEYSPMEKQQALEILSVLLLRMRDGKTRGIKPRGVLINLAKEIISAAKEEGGFPDSDDEEDDSDAFGSGGGSKKTPPRKSRKSTKEKLKQTTQLDSDDDEEALAEAVPIEEDDPAPRPSVVRRKTGKERSSEFARPSVSGGGGGGGGYGRKRMGVFTKHIEARNHDSKRRGSAAYGRRSSWNNNNNSGKYGARKSTPGVGRDSESGERDSVANGAAAANAANGSYFSYFFGSSAPASSTNRATDTGNEMVTIEASGSKMHHPSFIDISNGNTPPDVQVLNIPETNIYKNKAIKPVTGENIDLLVDDVVRLLGDALSSRSGSSKDSMRAVRESEAYKQALFLAFKLSKADVEEMMARDDKTVFLKLSNALCMHASIELNCEMKQISAFYGEKIGYNVGGKLVTNATIANLY